MFGALLSTLFHSIANILRKNALNISRSSHPSMYVFGLFGMTGTVVIIAIYLWTGMVPFGDLLVGWRFILMLMLVSTIALIFRPLNQHLYQEEKMSVLMPYTNLNKIFSVVASYFIFKDVSTLSLWIILFTIVVIIGFSLDFKHLKFPKMMGTILLVESLISVRYLLMSYIILEIGDRVFYIYDGILYLVILIVIVFTSHTQSQITHFTRQFYMNRFGAAITGAAGTVISLYLISELGASIVILLGFVQMLLILVFAYFFLKEVPSKKDIWMTTLVMLLVGIGFYFR